MTRKISTKRRNTRSPKKKPVRSLASTGLQTFTANDLQTMDFPPLNFFVEGLIPEGLTLLAGKPKMGKSWMALDLAMSIASGTKALGERTTKKGTTLYCALEDNQRRLQRRIRHNYGNQDAWPSNFHMATQLNKFDQGGLEQLEEWIDEHRPSLVIIDTLVCIKPKSDKGNGYDADYGALAPLQELAGEYGIAIVVIHHLRKLRGDDPLDMVSGTTGLTGAADSILVLDRKSHGTTLYGRGREMEDIDIAMQLEDGLWQILGDSDAVKISSERKAIIEVLENAEKPMGPKAIAEALDQPEDNVRQLLTSMARDGEVKKEGRGKYITP
ncbi:AAA family ATPase [Hoeflea sp. EC-HK425]|uniref:AAA family ATPase n=1 Tax=Hoeflea sp. EC-HK425 TaxID=2038388 RepID=UPI0012543C22|nr:AAA family ATPase [Hoeflea sp. EC-HK425]VVT02599.1 Recombinase A [Hoeflea sp. EC-HK425]|tara:strand:- start:111 stop:1091 length:981 start_codon:yes stop_codon:yes gene_type:complete